MFFLRLNNIFLIDQNSFQLFFPQWWVFCKLFKVIFYAFYDVPLILYDFSVFAFTVLVLQSLLGTRLARLWWYLQLFYFRFQCIYGIDVLLYHFPAVLVDNSFPQLDVLLSQLLLQLSDNTFLLPNQLYVFLEVLVFIRMSLIFNFVDLNQKSIVIRL